MSPLSSEERTRLQALVAAWKPDEADLPDEIGRALDADPAFRSWFDARFAATSIPKSATPVDLRDRMLPRSTRPKPANTTKSPWPRRMAIVALASPLIAAAFLVAATMSVGIGGLGMELAAPQQKELQSLRDQLGVDESPRSAATLRASSEEDDRARRDDAQAAGVDRGNAGWIRTADDPLSTFAVDVDTGSYTYARRVLRGGSLPRAEDVRVEEFINYLSYDYAGPRDDAPFAVEFAGAPSPWNDRHRFVRIGLQARADTGEKPAHLTFLVDVSGSMRGEDRLPLVKTSLHHLVDALQPSDTVSLVVYAGSSGVALGPTSVREQATILNAIDALEAGGSTAMGEGIAAAYQLAEQTYEGNAINRVILCSDGDANVGVTDVTALSALIKEHAERGITLTTLGFGMGNFRDQRMEQLADDGDGNYVYVDGEAEARRVFVERLPSTLDVIAGDTKIQVDWNPKAVSRYRLVGYENRAVRDEDFRDDAVDGGEIGAGHQVTALYELDLKRGGAEDLAVVNVRSEPAGPEAPASERTWTLRRSDISPSFDAAPASFRLAFGAAEFAEHLRGVDGIDLQRVRDLTAAATDPRHDEHAEIVGLIERAIDIGKPAAPSPMPAPAKPAPTPPADLEPASGPFDITVNYYTTANDVTVRCSKSGFEQTAPIVRGFASFVDVPAREDCGIAFNNGATYRPVRGNTSIMCNFGPTECKLRPTVSTATPQSPTPAAVAAPSNGDVAVRVFNNSDYVGVLTCTDGYGTNVPPGTGMRLQVRADAVCTMTLDGHSTPFALAARTACSLSGSTASCVEVAEDSSTDP